ncbi:MAG: hemerythrin [Desulfuromonas sp.]|nr:MAG: hemerythrin [Desulfuromonas sp.]
MGLLWSRDFAVGDETIDGQHQELFNHFNTLLDACKRGQGKDHVGELLGFLADYVDFHFSAEERRMAESSYPEAADHRLAHADFTEQMANLRREYDQSGANASLIFQINDVLLHWLLDHIRQVDTRFGRYLQKAP